MQNEASLLTSKVIDRGLCVGCGICTSISDTDFEMHLNEEGKYEAKRKNFIEESEVKKYLKICPFSNEAPNEDELGHYLYPDLEKNSILGHFSKTFVGGSLFPYRENSSSGGMATYLSIYLLTNKLVDGIVHVGNIQGEGIFNYQISKSPEEVINASKSKYYPITMSSVLNQIKSEKLKVAIVGIPCFIKSIRLLQREDSVFQNLIKYTIGINCGHLKSKFFMESLAWQEGIHPEKIVNFNFRKHLINQSNRDYGFEISYKDDEGNILHKVSKYPSKYYYGEDWGLGFFKYKSCDYCDDVFAEVADITLGDAWIKPYSDKKLGTNVIVTRNRELEDILHRGALNKEIELSEIEAKDVINSQAASIRHRRSGLSYRLSRLQSNSEDEIRKRVKPSNNFELNFKRVQDKRLELRKESTKHFKIALERNDITHFFKGVEKTVNSYYSLKGNTLTNNFLGRRIILKLKAFLKTSRNNYK